MRRSQITSRARLPSVAWLRGWPPPRLGRRAGMWTAAARAAVRASAQAVDAVERRTRRSGPAGTIHVVDPAPLNWLWVTYNTVEELVRVTPRGKGPACRDERLSLAGLDDA